MRPCGRTGFEYRWSPRRWSRRTIACQFKVTSSCGRSRLVFPRSIFDRLLSEGIGGRRAQKLHLEIIGNVVLAAAGSAAEETSIIVGRARLAGGLVRGGGLNVVLLRLVLGSRGILGGACHAESVWVLLFYRSAVPSGSGGTTGVRRRETTGQIRDGTGRQIVEKLWWLYR